MQSKNAMLNQMICILDNIQFDDEQSFDEIALNLLCFYFSSQQDLDNVLYGYTAQKWNQGTCTHALSGLKVGEITHGKSVEANHDNLTDI